MFPHLPRLNSGFLNTSQQTSGNIQTLKTPPKDVITPTSSPKPKSVAPNSPRSSPRPQSRSPQSPALSSKPSSPRSQSSHRSQSEASTAASSKSKPKELPSPLLSPNSATKRHLSIPASAKKTVRNRAYRAVTAKKALSYKTSSPSPPKEPCSPAGPPTRAFDNSLTAEERLTSSQTGILTH